jgi:hypothetical protein
MTTSFLSGDSTMTRFRIPRQFTLRFGLVMLTVSCLAVWKFTPQIRAAILQITAPMPDSPFDSTRTISRRDVWASFHDMHRWYEQQFVNSDDGFGLSRVINFDDPFFRKIEIDGQLYLVQQLELVSFADRETPIAYVNRNTRPAKMTSKQAETRTLSEFEKRALLKLQIGRQFIYNGDAKQPEFVGALRASASCLKCHEAKSGDLMGAFAYRLQPVRDPFATAVVN